MAGPPLLANGRSQASVFAVVADEPREVFASDAADERGSPISTALRPPDVMPPKCRPGSAMTARLPCRAA